MKFHTSYCNHKYSQTKCLPVNLLNSEREKIPYSQMVVREMGLFWGFHAVKMAVQNVKTKITHFSSYRESITVVTGVHRGPIAAYRRHRIVQLLFLNTTTSSRHIGSTKSRAISTCRRDLSLRVGGKSCSFESPIRTS